MTYNLTSFDGAHSYSVIDQAIDTAQTPVSLVGRGSVGYGSATAGNFIHLAENFACPNDGSSQPNPAITAPPTGMVWFDKTLGKLRVNIGTSGSPIWEVVGRPTSNTVAPANPRTGDLWYDTANNLLKVWNSAAWVAVNPGNVRTDASTAPTVDNTWIVGDSTHRFANIFATVFTGEATSAQYADLAERYATSEPLEPGDVVALGGDAEICKTVGYMSPEVIGVISTNPAFRMNEDAGDDSTHPFVAMSGRVPCKVMGMVRKGQRLVASHIPGVAIAVALTSETYLYSVLGRSLANKETMGVELIEIVVGVK